MTQCLLLVKSWTYLVHTQQIKPWVEFFEISGDFFYRKSTIGTTKAAIKANNGTYYLQKRIGSSRWLSWHRDREPSPDELAKWQHLRWGITNGKIVRQWNCSIIYTDHYCGTQTGFNNSLMFYFNYINCNLTYYGFFLILVSVGHLCGLCSGFDRMGIWSGFCWSCNVKTWLCHIKYVKNDVKYVETGVCRQHYSVNNRLVLW